MSSDTSHTNAQHASTGMNFYEGPDLASYGISPSGEPLDTTTPLGKRIASLPFQQRIDFRLGQDGQPILKDLIDGTRNISAWAQTRGAQATYRCNYCAAGKGPFTTCMILKSQDGQFFFEGSCANCQFHRQGSKCSFRVTSTASTSAASTASPGQLLKSFQSVMPNPGPQKHQREPQQLPKARRVSFGNDETYEPPVAHKKRRMNDSSSSPATGMLRPRPSQPEPDNIQTDVSVTPTTADSAPRGPAKSKADGVVLPCPLNFTLFNDAGLLRQAIQDLSSFTRVARARLRKLEQAPDSALDLWGSAMVELEKQTEQEEHTA